jgi:hypothetical protein
MRREMGDFNEQLEKMRNHPGFIAARIKAAGAHATRCVRDVCRRASNADAHHDQPCLHRGAHHRRHEKGSGARTFNADIEMNDRSWS